jgi:two-component sensor histidine kinase
MIRLKPALGLVFVAMVAAVPWGIVAANPALSVVLDQAPFLVFHNVAELFSVVVSLSIFGLGWFSFRQTHDGQALFWGAAFLAVGLLDLAHALGYAGMPPLVNPNGPNKATLFWLAARITTAAAFLGSAALQSDQGPRWVCRLVLLAGSLGWVALVFVAVTVFPSWLPVAFDDTTGLTPFKKATEYAIIAGFAAAAVAHGYRFTTNQDPLGFTYLAALIFCIAAEVEFTVYRSVFDTDNVLGHVDKVIAFGLIYRAVFVATVRRPYEKIRKTAEERETLLRELYHRTKNTLQMVQGLVVLQASEGADVPEVKELVRKTEERIQAISLVHQRLFDSKDLSRIDMKDYVDDLGSLAMAGHHPARNHVRFDVKVDDGAILLDMAVPLGLVLNELLANSLSHGFPGDAEGTITVRLGPCRPGWLLFQYDDDGIGLPAGFDLDRAETLGLTLIRTIGTQQLKGKVELSGNQGFRCRVEFPDDLYRPRV